MCQGATGSKLSHNAVASVGSVTIFVVPMLREESTVGAASQKYTGMAIDSGAVSVQRFLIAASQKVLSLATFAAATGSASAWADREVHWTQYQYAQKGCGDGRTSAWSTSAARLRIQLW